MKYGLMFEFGYVIADSAIEFGIPDIGRYGEIFAGTYNQAQEYKRMLTEALVEQNGYAPEYTIEEIND